ncbi:MAG: DUF4301 family protein [Flavobacteriaceae bacterium]
MFTEQDLQLLSSKGISKEKVLDQIDIFKEGIPFVKLNKAAVVGDGILRFSEGEERELIGDFESKRKDLDLLKFVPASGAASRMFKMLFQFLEGYDSQNEELGAYFDRVEGKELQHFYMGAKQLPFFKLAAIKVRPEPNNKGAEFYNFVHQILSEDGLNYGFYPKGLLPFHKYGNHLATPFEEHLKEAALYSGTNGIASLHFTVSEQHNEMFNSEQKRASQKVGNTTGINFNVGFSNQKPTTDTIAVDPNNKLFRNGDGSLLFRPGGHGALIENLNEQDADIIFIKNIDNVVPDKNLEAVSNSKKMLAGLLLRVQEKAFALSARLEAAEVDEAVLGESMDFLEKELNVRFIENFEEYTLEEKTAIIRDKINRPIRICGMVKNEGEPGGGPFWIEDDKGRVSLQIIESAQIDKDHTEQFSILQNASHFNPVDLVCGVRNHKGEKYDLMNFIDVKQGFITEKTKEGRQLKALELPGLWNGAMAYWNTLFVEVPSVTFNPVKTVNDLLRPSHQVGQ